MMEALRKNKPDFVELLLENGIVMSLYLDLQTLQSLYNAVSINFLD